MSYLVTGATGFIGRFLVPELLERDDGDVHVLVRRGSEGKLAHVARRWNGGDRVKPVPGDLGKPGLGIDPAWTDAHRGEIEHMFHLAAVYDMTASDELNRRLNTGGTRHAVDIANDLRVDCLHHTSSVAAAGLYEGVFTEDMFDEGQELPTPYHRTKYASEEIVRTEARVRWRVYRPSIVVGHSVTGEMDKIDGPYYFFKLLRMGGQLPKLLPLMVPRFGETNMVPVDFVARAMAHIAHLPGPSRLTFHLVNPERQSAVEALNLFADEAGAPHLIEVMPKQSLNLAMKVPGIGRLTRRLGVPHEVIEHSEFTCRFDCTRTVAALTGTEIVVPPLAKYAPVLWKYWLDNQ